MSNYEKELRSIIDSALELDGQIKEIREEIKDLLDEAGEKGYDKAILRKIIAREKKGRIKVRVEDEQIAEYEGRAGLGR